MYYEHKNNVIKSLSCETLEFFSFWMQIKSAMLDSSLGNQSGACWRKVTYNEVESKETSIWKRLFAKNIQENIVEPV